MKALGFSYNDREWIQDYSDARLKLHLFECRKRLEERHNICVIPVGNNTMHIVTHNRFAHAKGENYEQAMLSAIETGISFVAIEQ